ncbi:MAG: hypothetical protein IV086_03080 [Hyphomonadaceae bacterium]|nr:hypothetical protein [Hyphomonadaceae bacterium]
MSLTAKRPTLFLLVITRVALETMIRAGALSLLGIVIISILRLSMPSLFLFMQQALWLFFLSIGWLAVFRILPAVFALNKLATWSLVESESARSDFANRVLSNYYVRAERGEWRTR